MNASEKLIINKLALHGFVQVEQYTITTEIFYLINIKISFINFNNV